MCILTFTFVFVSCGVSEARSLACFPSKKAVKVGSDLVLASGLDSVTLGASLNEQLLALLNIVSAHLKIGIAEMRNWELERMTSKTLITSFKDVYMSFQQK